MSKHKPILFILGSTGTGKSKLSLHLAKKFNGEIISADSMQVYEGLDIVTNKVTKEEQSVAPHHMLNVVSPFQFFTVVDFRNKVLPIIEDVMKRDRLPIIVGGTYYYVESLLWKMLIGSPENLNGGLLFEKDCVIEDTINQTERNTNSDSSVPSSDEPKFRSVYQSDLPDISNEKLYKHLQTVDPKAADLVHPNRRRQVIRYLQVFEQTGRLYSDHLNEQHSEDGGNYLGGPLRFPNSCILWLDCQQEELTKRLESRVDEMISLGLIDELNGFHKIYNEERLKNLKEPDYTHGIFQSIGFKEFHQYLTLDAESRCSDEGKLLFEEGITAMKIVTRRYSKKQIKWFNRRVLKCADRQVPPVYALNCTDLNLWAQEVENKSDDIVSAFIDGRAIPHDRVVAEPVPVYKRKLYTCLECDRIISGEEQWISHMNSKKHMKMVHFNKRKQSKAATDASWSWWSQFVRWAKSVLHLS